MGRTALLACPGVQDAHPGVRGSLRGLRGDTGTLHGHSTRAAAAPCVCRMLPVGGISLHTSVHGAHLPVNTPVSVCCRRGRASGVNAGVSGERMGGQAAGAGGGTGTCRPPGKSSAPALRLCVKQDQPLP